MKNNFYLLVFVVCLTVIQLQAQENQGMITYIRNPGDPATEITIDEWFSKDAYIYIQRKFVIDYSNSPAFKNKRYTSKADSLNDVKIISELNQQAKEDDIVMPVTYRNIHGNTFVVTRNLSSKKYCVYDTVPTLKWELLEDTTSLEGYICQKAKCEFIGSVFYAWYAPGIPYPFGPLRLGGLPGLILEAWNEKKTIIYKTKELSIPAKQMISITPCNNGIVISKIQMNEILIRDQQDKMNLLNSFKKQNN